ncbi:hypothetical protein A6U95_28200 [Serratia sp. 14-2641]|nr:hypothetical protein A6U95_28200 [Serratia sp. 14-2641]
MQWLYQGVNSYMWGLVGRGADLPKNADIGKGDLRQGERDHSNITCQHNGSQHHVFGDNQ